MYIWFVGNSGSGMNIGSGSSIISSKLFVIGILILFLFMFF